MALTATHTTIRWMTSQTVGNRLCEILDAYRLPTHRAHTPIRGTACITVPAAPDAPLCRLTPASPQGRVPECYRSGGALGRPLPGRP